MRPHALLVTTTLALLLSPAACDSGDKAADKKAETKVDKKADAKADAKADTKEEPKEKTEAEKQEEGRKRNHERLQELEKAKAEEAARWTDEVKAEVKKLVGKKFKSTKEAMAVILKSPHRHPDNVARDPYRHPAETLEFFGITPTSVVIEVGPGAGWYTEVLAPLLATQGKLIITDYDPEAPDHTYTFFAARRMQAFLERSPELFGKIEKVIQSADGPMNLGADASADFVFLARTMHGWQNGGKLEENLKEVHRVLKPGGIAAIVQHRAKPDAKPEESAKNGYLPEPWLIETMKGLGFELVGQSEVNANAEDTTDWPEGVWTLPPTLALKDKDKDKYEAIGESDRMTLKFKKV